LGTYETTPAKAGNKVPTSTLSRIWDTRDVGQREAFAYYHDAMCVAFNPVVPRVAANERVGFSARVESRAAGSGFVNWVEAVTHRVARTSREIAHAPDDWVYLFHDPRGCCSVTQNGTEVTARAGDVVLFSGADPFELVHAREPRLAVTTLLTRGEAFRQRLGDAGPTRPVVVSDHPAFGALMREAVRLFAQQSAQLSPEAAAALFDSTVELARLACAPSSAAKALLESRSGLLFQLVSSYVERNFRNPQLGAARIAAAHGISPRYIHKLFEQYGPGQSLTKYVIDCRLAWAARRLADPRAQHATVTDTAFAAGFSDLTHFYRAFRRRYGAAPGKFRAAPIVRGPFAD
jgi:AraC family transcriptional regulator, positive regulator of tynA and feaB